MGGLRRRLQRPERDARHRADGPERRTLRRHQHLRASRRACRTSTTRASPSPRRPSASAASSRSSGPTTATPTCTRCARARSIARSPTPQPTPHAHADAHADADAATAGAATPAPRRHAGRDGRSHRTAAQGRAQVHQVGHATPSAAPASSASTITLGERADLTITATARKNAKAKARTILRTTRKGVAAGKPHADADPDAQLRAALRKGETVTLTVGRATPPATRRPAAPRPRCGSQTVKRALAADLPGLVAVLGRHPVGLASGKREEGAKRDRDLKAIPGARATGKLRIGVTHVSTGCFSTGSPSESVTETVRYP